MGRLSEYERFSRHFFMHLFFLFKWIFAYTIVTFLAEIIGCLLAIAGNRQYLHNGFMVIYIFQTVKTIRIDKYVEIGLLPQFRIFGGIVFCTNFMVYSYISGNYALHLAAERTSATEVYQLYNCQIRQFNLVGSALLQNQRLDNYK